MVAKVNDGEGIGGGSATQDVTMVANTTVGNLLVLVLMFSNEFRTVSSVTGAGTWTEAHALQTQSSVGGLVIYYCRCTSATSTITITLNGSSSSIAARVIEFSTSTNPAAETGTSTVLNQSAATDWTVAAVTPASAQCVFVGGLFVSTSGGTWTDDGDFTYHLSGAAERIAYRIQTGTAAQSFLNTSTNAVSGMAMLAAFEATDGGGGAGKPMNYYAQQ